MVNLDCLCKCLRRKPRTNVRRVSAANSNQSDQQSILLVSAGRDSRQHAQQGLRGNPHAPVVAQHLLPTAINIRPASSVVKLNLVTVTSSYDNSKLECRDFKPEKADQAAFPCVCPICFRYFNHIYQTSCCSHYICHYCVDDMNKHIVEHEIENAPCHFCKTENLRVADVNIHLKARRYTDSSVSSYANTFTNSFTKVNGGSPTRSKGLEGEPIKGKGGRDKNTFSSTMTITQPSGNKYSKRRSDGNLDAGRINQYLNRSYMSDSNDVRKYLAYSQNGGDDEKASASFSSQKMDSVDDVDSSINKSDANVNIEDKSAAQQEAFSVISEKDNEDITMTMSVDLNREKSNPHEINNNQKNPLAAIIHQLTYVIPPARERRAEEEEEDEEEKN